MLGTENVAIYTTAHKNFFRETKHSAATEGKIQASAEVYSRPSVFLGLPDS
jgi:hypothetical protein